MKIHLNEPEIHEAIKIYVESQGFSLKNRDVEIEMTTGRNPTRVSADISINKLDKEDNAQKLGSVEPTPVGDTALFEDDD